MREADYQRRQWFVFVGACAVAAGLAPISGAVRANGVEDKSGVISVTAATTPASILDLKGLEGVQVTSFQALPPPYEPGRAVLSSPAALTRFEHVVRADRIGRRRCASDSHGCTGGVEWTVAVTTKTGQTTLSASQCGGGITGNISGNVTAFVRYLGSIVS